MVFAFRQGAVFGVKHASAELTVETINEQANIVVKKLQASKPKGGVDQVTDAWNKAGQPDEGVVVNGQLFPPLPFGRSEE